MHNKKRFENIIIKIFNTKRKNKEQDFKKVKHMNLPIITCSFHF